MAADSSPALDSIYGYCEDSVLESAGFTIDGARQRIDQYRRTGELRASARKAFEAELATEVRAAIEDVVKILDGRADGPRG